jgi:hypothetical protein
MREEICRREQGATLRRDLHLAAMVNGNYNGWRMEDAWLDK